MVAMDECREEPVIPEEHRMFPIALILRKIG
jgi:hypothetical protein